MEEEKIETYSPPTEELVSLDIEADTTGFDDIIDDTGLIPTKLNEKVIIQRIAKDLYKNASSGLRELYNNSVRACKIAGKKDGLEFPLIRITMNEAKRTLIIQDNGIGITKERFKKVLLELGTSDNLDEGEVGQFGMGFASYSTLSSVVLIDTKCRNGDQYKMIAKDGMSFQPLGATSLKEYGTRLEMTCYSEVNFTDLVHKLVAIAKYSGVQTILELAEFDYCPSGMRNGQNMIKQFTFDGDVKLFSDSKHIDIVEIETDDFRFVGLIDSEGRVSNSQHVYLLNTPIESTIKVPFNWWVINIKDERKFMPMPDRDRMREDADRKLSMLLNQKLQEHFRELVILNYQDFLDSDKQNEFLWLGTHMNYCPDHLHDLLVRIHNCTVRDVLYDTKKFQDVNLLRKLLMNKRVIYQGYKNREITGQIKKFKLAWRIITVKKSKVHDWKSDVEFMDSWGIPNGRQILIDNKVKMPKAEKGEFELIGHTHIKSENMWRNYEHDVVALDDIDETFIRADSVPINDILRYVRGYSSCYTFVRNATELDEYDCSDFSEWVKSEVPNIVCATNKGAMTIKDIAKGRRKYEFCEDYQVDFEYFFKDEKKIIIYGNEQLLAMLFHLNPECKLANSYSNTPANDVIRKDFHEFVNEKYDVNLDTDYDKKFFCNHMQEVPKCFHSLFGNLLKSVPYQMEDDKKVKLFPEYLEMVKKYQPIEDDDIARLRFYYGENAKMADRMSNMASTLESLLSDTKNKIIRDEVLIVRLLEEVLMPKVFGHVEFRSCKKEVLDYGRHAVYEVNLATRDTEFSFSEDMKVFDFTLQFKGLKMKINKGYCSVKVVVHIET